MRIDFRAVVSAALLCLLALQIVPVSSWSSVRITGDWALINRNHFVRNGTGISGYAEWNNTVADFNGYRLSFYNVTWVNYREWWQFETINDLYIKLNLTTANGLALVVTKLHGSTSFFGLLNTLHVSVGASTNGSWDQVSLVVPPFYSYGLEVTGWNPEEFQLFVKPESNQTRLTWIWDVGGRSVGYTITLPLVLDGVSNITLIYEHSGDGYVEGCVEDSFALPAMPYYENIKSGVVGWLSGLLGIDLGFAVQILLSIVVLFVGIVRMTLPLLGVIVFLWIMDTIYTAITTGEIRLIGDMFLKIYEFLMAIWRTLVGIIQAVWDLITFWS